MYAEVAWALVSSGTQVQPQIIPDPGYLPGYPSVFYDYDKKELLIKKQDFSTCQASENVYLLSFL